MPTRAHISGLASALAAVCTSLCGCGTTQQNVTGGAGGRETLPSTVVEDDGILPSDVVDGDPDVSGNEDYSDYTIVATPVDAETGQWQLGIASARGRVGDDGEFIFTWDFGDGNVRTGASPTYTFSEPGTHLITVTASGRKGATLFVLTLELNVPSPNLPPIADAGDDVTVDENAEVFLHGGDSFDPDEAQLTYLWTQTSGDPVELISATGPTARFVAPDVEADSELVFTLTVSDGEFNSQDSVTVYVVNYVAPASYDPVADAGPDQVVPELSVVTLDGTQSSGSGNAPLMFEWSQLTGPTVALTASGEAVATFQAPDVADGDIAVLTFELIVTEVDVSAADEVTITVEAASTGGTEPPTTPPTGCVSNVDCDDGLFCNGVETCVSGTCLAGVAIDCSDGTACTVDSCNEATGTCDNVPNDALCDNGLFCDGTETCDALAGCQVGSPINCDDGIACTVDSCNEAADTCDNVPSDALCNNGLFCDGTERCNPAVGCQAGSPIDCDDGIVCTIDTCNEAADSCDNVPSDALCNNGLFCDGAETCDATLGCRVGSDPCAAQVCHEDTDSCEAIVCASDGDCDDTLFCNGTETCVGGTCQPGIPADCDDGIGCTIDSCNEATDSCDNVPNDALCDNGLFCDGTETCDPIVGCQAGTAIACDDGVGCTADSCNEATDSCDHVPNDALCDNGLFCDGAETCDPIVGCQAGTAIDCDDGVGCTADSCNEAADSCDHVPNDAPCDNGLFCDGTETCDPGLGCQAGTDPCGGDPCDESSDACVPPTLALSTTTLDFGLISTSLVFEVWNSGGGTLTYGAAPEAGVSWLSVAPGGGTSAGEHDALTASVDRTGLAEGTYQGGITVTPSLGSAVVIVVTMAVGPAGPGSVHLSEDFQSYSCGADPTGWFDTGANNSRTEDASLFVVGCPGAERAFGTASTLTNIHSHYVSGDSSNWSSYAYSGRMMMTSSTSGLGVTFLSHFPGSDSYYRLRRGDFGGGYSFHMSPHGTSITGGTTNTGVSPAANQWYRFAIEVLDTGSRTEIRAKVWADGSPEPGTWQIDCYDASSTRLTSGTVGMWSMGSGSKYWDDLSVNGLNCDLDSDNDGVADCRDGCRQDPNKTSPGVCGCGTPDADADNDGILNCNDQCPGMPDADTDGDGTADCLDGCPDDQNKTAAGACGCGTPDTDTDGDGTPDCLEPPTLCINPNSLSFGSTTTSLGFEVWNCGGGSLDYTIADNASWLGLSPTSGTSSGEHGTITATVSRSGLADNTYQADITVTPSVGGVGTVRVTMTVGASGGLPMTAANRTSGVAPLGVFFDAVDTASGVIQPTDGDYAALYYKWDFGDPSSGVWSTDGKSKNEATGYVAAHVFETPGTYTATLRVTTPSGATYDYQQDITVQPISGPTYYVSSSTGSDSNSGLSASAPFNTFGKALSMLGTNVRILFKRGDSWTIGGGVSIDPPGPGVIGAYGSGPKPVIQVTGTDVGFRFSGRDWRLMDLDIVGPGPSSTQSGIAGSTHPGWVNGLILRMTSRRFRVGVGVSDYIEPHDGNMLVDCDIHDIDINGVYLGGRRLAVLGNAIQDITVSHVLRIWQMHKGVISHNVCRNPGPTRHALKLHGPVIGRGRPDTEYVVVSDNVFAGKTWAAVIGPENVTSDQRLSNIVFERNLNLPQDGSVLIAVLVSASKVTMRNNVFDATGAGNDYTAISVTQHGIVPPPAGVKICNNTFYRSDAAGLFTGVFIDGTAQNTTVRNNLTVAPASSPRTQAGGGSGLVVDHNLVTDTPWFTNPGADDFSLQASSPAIDAGVNVPGLLDDFIGTQRPRGRTDDVGAYEY